MSVSDKIRALDQAGYPRTEIARVLGKRYQHVRNVLEADKLHPPRARQGAASQRQPASVQEAPRPYEGALRLVVEPGGVIRLPPEAQAVLGVREGGVVVAEVGEDRLTLLSGRAAMAKVEALVASLNIDPARILSEELVAARRAENELDGRDG
jgi:hypothetical protein